MTAKIVEVLAKILEGININQISLDEINKILSEKNEFDKQTVSAAFSLIYDKILVHKISDRNKHNKKAFRVLTDEEKEILGTENINYLMYLMNVGLVDSNDMEMILEQVMMFLQGDITKEDINWIVFISLVDFNSEILPGSRVLLYSSDRIN